MAYKNIYKKRPVSLTMKYTKAQSDLLYEFMRYSGFDATTKDISMKIKGGDWFSKTMKGAKGVKASIPPNYLLHHFQTGNCTIALPKYPHTKNVMIDIDGRNQLPGKTSTEATLKTIELMESKPFLLEKSPSTQGFHLFFKFNEYVSDYALQMLTEEMKKYGFVIEPIIGKKKLRLPGSSSYKRHLGVFDPNSRTLIGEKIQSLAELKDTFEFMYHQPGDKLGSFLKQHNKFGTQISKTRLFQNTITRSKESLQYGCGTRVHAQIRLGFVAIGEGMDFRQFVALCEDQNDGTSKDMKLPVHKRDKILKQIYTWCKKNYASTYVERTPETELSLETPYHSYVDVELSNMSIEKLEEVLVYGYDLIDWFTHERLCNKQSTIRSAIFLYEQMAKKMLHDKAYGRRYNFEDGNKYNDLNKGVIFPVELRKKMAKEFDLPNINQAHKLLRDLGIIQSIKIPDDKGIMRDYSYKGIRFAKHYKIENPYISYLRIVKQDNEQIKKLTTSYDDLYQQSNNLSSVNPYSVLSDFVYSLSAVVHKVVDSVIPPTFVSSIISSSTMHSSVKTVALRTEEQGAGQEEEQRQEKAPQSINNVSEHHLSSSSNLTSLWDTGPQPLKQRTWKEEQKERDNIRREQIIKDCEKRREELPFKFEDFDHWPEKSKKRGFWLPSDGQIRTPRDLKALYEKLKKEAGQ